ncbi:hypothetical protein F5X96DRAFT_14077 [Biscogniauxia mediterranea]|nr:hypothetical protein F5X96DRAFT_14077 [Biscogniauxia mediterranea]
MYTPTPPPPVPPPKPSSHEASRLGTPATDTNSPRPPPPVPDNNGFHADGSIAAEGKGKAPATEASGLILAPPTTGHGAQPQPPQPIPDPGEHWLPKILEDKSKQDLAEILGDPALLSALTYGTAAAHPSLAQTQDTLQAALQENVELAGHLSELEARLTHQRAAAQAQLLSTHALERQWRQKQSEMDDALAPFAPAALYGRLTRGLQEQEMMCQALEESFLDGGGGATAGADDGAGSGNNNGAGGGDGGVATERETLEWVRRYREARKLFYLRQERKERWNERRVGGWR